MDSRREIRIVRINNEVQRMMIIDRKEMSGKRRGIRMMRRDREDKQWWKEEEEEDKEGMVRTKKKKRNLEHK